MIDRETRVTVHKIIQIVISEQKFDLKAEKTDIWYGHTAVSRLKLEMACFMHIFDIFFENHSNMP